MHIDEDIRKQGYIYFLAEAPELLETIEQELFTLSENFSIAKVHTLMRATHTLKGGAANVGLEIINTIAHSLEDVFKALYNPDLATDNQLQTLVLQAYECLRLAITAELTGSAIDGEEVLQRATSVFTQLREQLGDAFGADHQIPTSEELGFDIVKSIFEVGVQQRLTSIQDAINHPLTHDEFIDFLTSHAEVFIGLAESLNLPGFGAIAQTILAALTANPSKVNQIAEVALANLKQAHAEVLAGDRVAGGEVSPELQAFSITTTSRAEHHPANTLNINEIKDLYHFLTTIGNNINQPLKPAKAKFYLKVIRYIFGWFHHQKQIPKQNLNLGLLVSSDNEHPVSYIENWLQEFLDFVQEPGDRESFCIYRRGITLTIILAVIKFYYANLENDHAILVIKKLRDQIIELAKAYKKHLPVNTREKNWIDNPRLQVLLEFKEVFEDEILTNTSNLIESIWGESNSLNLTDEIDIDQHEPSLTQPEILNVMADSVAQVQQQLQNHPLPSPSKNSRQPSFVRVEVEGLQHLNYLAGELLIYQKRRTLHDEQIQEIIKHLTKRLTRQQITLNKLRDLPLQIPHIGLHNTQSVATVNFDELEMDVYTEFYTTLHEAIEETLQLQETTESLELLLTQAVQIAEKKQSLILNIIDNLVEARMLPLGNILNRFSQMVTKLSEIYGKSVELRLNGTEVLVDKAIAQKLYEPLLHLVRNAFDHGIEPPQVRRELGKPEQGLIEIRAYHQGSQTMIAVRDDGQGINLEIIRKKALELNLIATHNDTESEILDLMFLPGFSTAHQVNEISGRGMGLDIVRSQLRTLNGSISVYSSPQQGTTFLLKIPFSMTIDKLMLVQAGGIVYALLLESIEKILIPSNQQIKEFEGKKVLHWQTEQAESVIPVRQLSELMSYNGSLINTAISQNSSVNSATRVTNNPVLLMCHQQEFLALEVDQIIGEQELVIRPLGSSIAPPKYIYGCTSLANGTLILVLDAALLLASSELQANLATMSLATADSTQLLSPSISASQNNKSQKVVLIVDDAISLRQTLTLTLQKSGYQVLQAQNGIEALEQLQLHPEIQLVISDLEMPRMNGFELLSHIRQHPNLTKLPVVILTSRNAEKHRQLAESLGANGYLTKPYLEDNFVSTIGDLINTQSHDLVSSY